MKLKKGISLLLVGAIVSSLMVGCSKKEEDTTEGLAKIRKEEVIKEKQSDKNVEDKEDKTKANTKENTEKKQENKTESKKTETTENKEETKNKDDGYEYDDDGIVLNKKYGSHLEEEAQKQDTEEEEVEGDIGEAWHEYHEEEDDSVGNDNIGYIGESNGVTVYVNLDSGKFHKSANAHDMDGAIEMNRDDAEASGYSPCGNCYR